MALHSPLCVRDQTSVAGIDQLESLRVLVVDDDPMLAEFLAIKLEALGCRVICASSADQAIRVVSRGVDMVVTDYQMPGRDGLQMVEELRVRECQSVPLHIVMMTARGDAETVERAVHAGVDDFLFKPVDPLRLKLSVASARRAARMHRLLQRRNAALSDAHDRMRGVLTKIQCDIEAAAGLHERLLPEPERLAGVRVAHVYKPAAQLGGDSIGASRVGNGRILFFVLDVQGHGVRASLDSFHFHHRLKQMRPSGPDELARAISSLNREIIDADGETYATLVAGIVDPALGEGWLVRAGHPAPILLDGKDFNEIEGEGAFPLGWFADAEYAATRFDFGPGKRLVLYSDGLTDCRDRGGRMLGSDGLTSLLTECSSRQIGAISAIVELALSLRDNNPQLADDVSLLALEPDFSDRVPA